MTATAPELSKSDFFDFVTSNDVTDAQYKQQMRSVNVFMEHSDSRSNPLLSEDPKEQNNNNLLTVTESQSISSSTMATATSSTTLQSFDSIWNVDRERERFETAMLEDLNKFCWNQDSDMNNTHHCSDTAISNKLISNNTDGQIYTLTVLNQDINETNTNRYWVKEEVSISSPTDMEQQPPLDLETILNIDQLNEFNQDSLNTNILPKSENFNYDEDVVNNQKTDRSSISLIKTEPFSYDDFPSNDKKDDSCSSLIGNQNILESEVEFNNNNNDWKLTDQNTESNESLLRSALQGKTLIRSIYQNIPLHPKSTKLDDNELKRVIISNNNKSDVPSMYQDTKSEVDILMSISPENGNISILLDDPNFSNGDNPSSTQSVDDIVLSPLDGNYSEEYEKLKRIASEMGESVLPPYCTVEAIDPIRSVYNIHNVNGELVTMIPTSEVQLPQHLQIVTASPTVTSTKTVTKKYRRIQNKNPAPTTQTQTGTAIQAATSTSNNVRKERSLHYCSICSKGFKDKYSVNVHVRTHTGEKPFACSLCGKSFRQKAHLAKHYQTHIAQKTAAANGSVKPTKQR